VNGITGRISRAATTNQQHGRARVRSNHQGCELRRISIHGLRHASATLLLKAGVPAHVVQQRLGHKRIEMTLGIYAHALPSMQQEAARRLGALLHGKSS